MSFKETIVAVYFIFIIPTRGDTAQINGYMKWGGVMKWEIFFRRLVGLILVFSMRA